MKVLSGLELPDERSLTVTQLKTKILDGARCPWHSRTHKVRYLTGSSGKNVMEFYAIWPYFAGVVLLLVLASAPFFAIADTPPNPRGDRISNLDGLRGFLACGVFFYHAAVYHQYLQDGQWVVPPSRFYALIGQSGVALFFMITGYLFWGRMIAERGRPNWIQLYTGRIFRIGPLYLFAIAVMLLLVFQRTDFNLHVPLPSLATEVINWSVLGIVGGPDVNGYSNTPLLLAGVTWTLAYEWKFYFSLIIIAFAARDNRTHLPFVAAGLTVSLICLLVRPDSLRACCTVLFSLGMLCASLERRELTPALPDDISSVAILGLLAAMMLTAPSVYAPWPMILLGGVFYLIISGANLFGLLSSRPARRLGDVSYGIYLLHGLVLSVVFAPASVRTFALGSPIQHWATMLACLIILLFVAAVTHVGIERVGIDFGKRVFVALESVRKVHLSSQINFPGRFLLLQSKLRHRWRNAKPPG
jgi:peptidoglycan/LPS O-acetylase OafA/YrhL